MSWKKICIVITCLVISRSLIAQDLYDLNIVVSVKSAKNPAGNIFVAGDFNNWQPADSSYRFTKEKNKWLLTIKQLQAGKHQFKITRSGWDKVEINNDGSDKNNRQLLLLSDTTIQLTVEAWKDDFPVKMKKHTATAQVQLLDSAFYIPQLDRYRRIAIYLPKGYKASKQRYPVLYMHDGQNLFDEFTSGFGEWKVDETLDSLIAKGRPASIVVAIDNGPKRLQEYNPFYFEKSGPGEGDAYIDFIATVLKPYIDNNYRTLQDNDNTFIAGSSIGGLISYYAILKRPDVFGKAGIFSPAFWTADSINAMTDSLANKVDGKLFFYIGRKEGNDMVSNMIRVTDSLGRYSKAAIYTAIDEKGEHNEKAWQKWFAEFYLWITAAGYNHIIRTND